jgi:hypothetical protein
MRRYQFSLRCADVGSSTGELGGDTDRRTRRRSGTILGGRARRAGRCRDGAALAERGGDKQSQTVERIRHARQHLCRLVGEQAQRRRINRQSINRRTAASHGRRERLGRRSSASARHCRPDQVVGHRSPAGQGSEQAVHRPLQYRRMIAQAARILRSIDRIESSDPAAELALNRCREVHL